MGIVSKFPASRHDSFKTGAAPAGVIGSLVDNMSKKRADKQQQPELLVINDSGNYDRVVRPAFPYKLSDGTVIDFTDREKYPLATDHVRFAPIPRPGAGTPDR